MLRGKRGETGTVALIGRFILMLIIVLGLIWLLIKYTGAFDRSLAECPDYCSPQCRQMVNNRIAGTENPLGDDWCKAGVYDISKSDLKYEGELIDGGAPGSELGLRCCILLPRREKPPPNFLGPELRISEIEEDDGRDNTVTNPPRFSAYFLDRELPLRNGEMVDIISNTDYTLSFELKNIDSYSGGKYLALDKKTKLTCNHRLLDEEGTDILGTSVEYTTIRNEIGNKLDICEQWSSHDNLENAFSSSTSFKLPSVLEEKNVELVVTLTEDEKGKYNPYAKYDTRFTINFKVQNPILIGGLTSAYTRDKTLRVSCRDDFDCKAFYWELVGLNEQCNNQNPSTLDEAVYDTEAQGKGTINIDREVNDDAYMCVYAVDKTERVYAKKTSFPIHIDRTPPEINADFHAFPDMYTTVECFENQAGGSGCTGTVGYHYINHPVDFIGALFSGLKDPKKCPSDRGAYNFMRVDQKTGDGIIPFYSSNDFMVLCVMVEDNAGNNARDILLTYNSWEILKAIAGDQLGQGGIGTGYTGYNFWT